MTKRRVQKHTADQIDSPVQSEDRLRYIDIVQWYTNTARDNPEDQADNILKYFIDRYWKEKRKRLITSFRISKNEIIMINIVQTIKKHCYSAGATPKEKQRRRPQVIYEGLQIHAERVKTCCRNFVRTSRYSEIRTAYHFCPVYRPLCSRLRWSCSFVVSLLVYVRLCQYALLIDRITWHMSWIF